MRNRINNTAVFVASSSTVVVGANGFETKFYPGDRLYEEYKAKQDKILVYEELLDECEDKLELAIHMLDILDDIHEVFHDASKPKVGRLYKQRGERLRAIYLKYKYKKDMISLKDNPLLKTLNDKARC